MGGCCSSSKKVQLQGTPVYYYVIHLQFNYLLGKESKDIVLLACLNPLLNLGLTLSFGSSRDTSCSLFYSRLVNFRLPPPLAMSEGSLSVILAAKRRCVLPSIYDDFESSNFKDNFSFSSPQCQPTSEEQQTFHSYNGSASAIAAGFFVGLNLDTSIPDTYRPPPAPIPFSVLFGSPHSPHVTLGSQGGKLDSADLSKHSSGTTGSFETSASEDVVNISDSKTLADILLSSPKIENSKTNLHNELASQDEDGCPICLEEYDAENPKWVTNCKHEYHFSCILEWLERSDSCPVCDKEMTLDHTEKLKKLSPNTSIVSPTP